MENKTTGDVFVLDLGRTLYVWHGQYSNFSEKAKGIGVANIINNHERGGTAKIVLLDKNASMVLLFFFFNRFLIII